MMETKTTIEAAPITPEETALIDAQLQLIDRQTAAFDQSFALITEQFEALQPAFEAQAALAERLLPLQELEIDRAIANAPIQDEILQIQLDNLRQGGVATDEQVALIEEIRDKGIESGTVDIERFRDQSIEALREELAPALGLRPGDTPLLDRGGDVAAEATRQFGQLTSGLEGAAAQAKLNFPLAASALQGQLGGFQQELGLATSQFQAALSESALANRARLATDFGSLGINLSTGTAPNIAGSLSALAGTRGSTATGSDPFGTAIEGIGALGGLFTGIGALSSKRLKDRIGGERDDDLNDEVLEKVARLPVHRWRYKRAVAAALGDHSIHVGTYAEDFAREFNVGDGLTINPLDSQGVMLASIKAVNDKIEAVERKMPRLNLRTA